ncbi:hypothetical protein WA538_005211, partial [Blastocystis sp. DL]
MEVRLKAIVKTPIFTVIPKKTYSELQGEYRFKHNKEYDIDFDNEIVEKWHLDLLIMRCTVCDPYVPYSKINEKSYARHEIEDYGTVGSLQDHLRAEHGKMICSLCANKGRLFPYELKLYARQVIQAHMSGVLKDPSQPIHVPCPVCNKVQYDAREVLIHCRANHVHCFLCGINDPSYYYASEEQLSAHYDKAHYPCHLCNMFVAATMMELIEHQNKEHGHVDSNNHLRFHEESVPSTNAEVASEWRTVAAPHAVPRPTPVSHFVTHPVSARSGNAKRGLASVQRPAVNSSTQHPTSNQSTQHPTSNQSTRRPTLNQSTQHPTLNQSTQHPTPNQRPSSRPQQPLRTQYGHLSTTAPPFVQREPAHPPLSFADLRTDLTCLLTTLIDLPTNAPKSKVNAYEMCKVLLELCTNIVDFMSLSTSSVRLSLSEDMRASLQRLISTTQTDIDITKIIVFGVTRDHARKIQLYIHQYRTPHGWTYFYHEGTSDFSQYTSKELWTIVCFLYLT